MPDGSFVLQMNRLFIWCFVGFVLSLQQNVGITKCRENEKIFVLCLLWCFFTGAARSKEVPQLANVLARQHVSLNGQWNYIVDVQEEGYYDYRMNVNRWGFFLNAKPQRPEDLIEYDFDNSPTMQVPGDWNTAAAVHSNSGRCNPFSSVFLSL